MISAEATLTSAWVRNPAARSSRSRSSPIRLPRKVAIKSRSSKSHSGNCPHPESIAQAQSISNIAILPQTSHPSGRGSRCSSTAPRRHAWFMTLIIRPNPPTNRGNRQPCGRIMLQRRPRSRAPRQPESRGTVTVSPRNAPSLESGLLPASLYAGYIFDLDGTIYLGDEILPGAANVIATLRRLDRRILFLSNNPTRASRDNVAKLARFGISVPPREVLNTVETMTAWLLRHHPGSTVFP